MSAPRRLVIDTDAANEIDDQFALAWALASSDRLRIEAITAAPYCHGHYLGALLDACDSTPRTPFEELAVAVGRDEVRAMTERMPPRIGMEWSLREIDRVLDAAAPTDRPSTIVGADRFMSAADDAVDSDAARAIIDLAHRSDEPLHVAVLGAPTNVAAALVLDPTIAPKLQVVFVAGYPSGSRHVDDSFNLVQDLHATNRIFAAECDLVYLPGYQVAESLSVSLPELDVHLCGHGGVAELLRRLFHDNPLARDPTSPGFGWVMWDLAPIAWLIDPSWVQHDRVRSASVGADHRWQPGMGEITEAFRIDRKAVFADFFSRVQ